MAPIRRYLRITKYSVLEVRIYLDNPALIDSWLLNLRNPVLPRVIQAVRPLVLPKLREENERVKGKSKKQKGVKDVVVEALHDIDLISLRAALSDDFEVSLFLTDVSTRHSVLTKQKRFHQPKNIARRKSSKLTGWLSGNEDKPIDIDNAKDHDSVLIREESDEEGPRLSEFKEVSADSEVVETIVSDDEGFQEPSDSQLEESNPSSKPTYSDADDKKKLGLRTEFDGFSIYGRILCLIVKRRGNLRPTEPPQNGAGRQMLENWVSTQAAQESAALDD